MSIHTRERKRIWCRLFGHGDPMYLVHGKPGQKRRDIVCSRCGVSLP